MTQLYINLYNGSLVTKDEDSSYVDYFRSGVVYPTDGVIPISECQHLEKEIFQYMLSGKPSKEYLDGVAVMRFKLITGRWKSAND